ncbi:MAG: homoserine dehydrogenase [Phycisphaerae bacterium]|jgi:homoserine dehydrogenase|nr:MAG: homoserine dehydrogenase [Phycisphaerae bacterium]
MNEPVGIALLGSGVVGRGVLAILSEQQDLLERRTGLRFEVCHVVCRDVNKNADLAKTYNLHTDTTRAVSDPRVKIVVEVMGGLGAESPINEAIRSGKHIVTANKALLAARGNHLFPLAKKHGVSIGFEASCAGGIPIIDALTRGLLSNRIDSLTGIINGTCNYILTQMTEKGQTYSQALSEAQKLGYAEADPTLDVNGRDSAQKLAILASLAFNCQVNERDIHITGIDTLQADDIRFAEELGYAIKLLGIAERVGDSLSLRVHPTLVHHGELLADVNGAFNAISLYGHAIGHQFFYGRGAGQMPTASAVVADILGVALGIIPHTFARLNIYPGQLEPARVLPFEQLRSRYYLRVSAADVPGVFADITAALGKHHISLSGVSQKESEEDVSVVPVVVVTHRATEGDIQAALKEIDALATIKSPTVCLRIVDVPKEFA